MYMLLLMKDLKMLPVTFKYIVLQQMLYQNAFFIFIHKVFDIVALYLEFG